MSILQNLFAPRRRGFSLFNRRQPTVTPRRGGIALGSILSLAAPFLIRRLMARRAEQRA